ncbi:adenylate/guanylate cyclase domain-containing protein [Hoyosella sp. YIM 151337]|uniref:adenylate/guanylate cyclase domain-containing protein n=1 Tax=Hoyosella sp. YIM 151337 TaxID=2992742 RepID=UPI0022365D54|nr:adenylate/guanylate cyclase domain-containing protein [Hoyosella sp. YIM 151337]MCW4353724.1 adenylate/guanylate cyclase domain-containing protein [Hoyosella sp. YIM 151337]
MTEIALIAVALIAVAAAVVLSVLLVRTRRELAALQREAETSATQRLLSGGREAVRTVWNTADLVRKKGFGAMVRTSIEDLASWAEVERPDLARLTPDGTVVIFFSDIEGSTALNEQLGDRAWVRLLERHDKLIRRSIKNQQGHVIKTQGDGFMVAFADAGQAVLAAMDIQKELGEASWARRHDVRVRIGIHMGKSVRRGDDLFGRNVALAARVADQAHGGETLVTRRVRNGIGDDTKVRFSDPREVELKGFDTAHAVYPAAPAPEAD